jgi:hypothetical protein
METIEYRGEPIAVREVARPREWLCRLLVADDGAAYLEYAVSVGPYKLDVFAVHRLTGEDFARFEAGELDLGVLARNLAQHDEAYGVFERRD